MNTFKLLFSIFICQMAGIVGSVFTAPAITNWYANLNKPSFAPPNWLFAPAWIALYCLMGISLYLVWKLGWQKKETKKAIYVFAVQLILNSLWSFLFFGLQSPFFGFVGIIFLWLAILATIIVFYSLSKKAAFLLLPYILWVSIAALLNFSVWQLNI